MKQNQCFVLKRRNVVQGMFCAPFLAACQEAARREDEIVVGSSPTGVPFSFVDPWTNQLTGSMIDAATAVVGSLSLLPTFTIVPFAALIPSLAARKIDMIAAAMLRTPEREKIVAFSEPILPYPAGLIVSADNHRSYPDLTALRDLRVGAQIGSRFIDQLRESGVRQVATYDGLADILRDVSFGRIDAGYGDELILRYQLRVGPKRNARLVADFQAPALEYLCLVMRKDDPLLPRVNEQIDRLRADLVPQLTRSWHLTEGA